MKEKSEKEEKKENKGSSDKKNKYLLILIVLVVLLIGVIGVFIFLVINDKSSENIGISSDKTGSAYVDPNASEWDDGIESEKEEIEGKILVPGYSGAQLKAGEKVLKLSIGNPKENTCYLQATLMLEDGTILYESDLLKPGTGYEKIELKQTLEAGEYEAMVRYQGYTLNEEKAKLNSCDSAFKLIVIK